MSSTKKIPHNAGCSLTGGLKGTVRRAAALCGIFLILECVSKCREMQFRGHRAAFQGEKPQAYWLQVKVFQHRNAA
jgi:hypothetical protein